MYGVDKEFAKAVKKITKAMADLGLMDKELWSHDELKAVAARAQVDVVDVMFVARYCR